MVNKEALDKIKILEQEYMENWGRNVDYTVFPIEMTQEKMVEVLERIKDTGESVLVGFNRIKISRNSQR